MTLYNATPSTLYPAAQTTITATDAPSGKSGSTGAFNVNGTGVQTRFVILLAATTTPIAGQADNLTIIMGDPTGTRSTLTAAPAAPATTSASPARTTPQSGHTTRP